MTLKGIIREFEQRIDSIETRQNKLLQKFEELKPLLIKYEEENKK